MVNEYLYQARQLSKSLEILIAVKCDLATVIDSSYELQFRSREAEFPSMECVCLEIMLNVCAGRCFNVRCSFAMQVAPRG